MTDYSDGITLFDRINLANCAMQRARQGWIDTERFNGEYITARAWTKYRCYISKAHQFVEYD